MDQETINIVMQYREIIGDSFPAFPLLTRDDVKEILKNCINEGKSVYDLGYLPIPEDNLDIYY